MTEILFILTTIFVAYVIYSIADGQKTAAPSPVPPPASPAEPPVAKAAPAAKATSALASAQPADAPVSAEPAAAVAVKPTAAEPAATIAKAPPVAAKHVAAEPVPTAAHTVVAKGSVRNPKTGEVATVTNNYRFTKRWIKEALVAEGLLTKIYKNNELDTAAEAAIKTALLELAAMAKYQV